MLCLWSYPMFTLYKVSNLDWTAFYADHLLGWPTDFDNTQTSVCYTGITILMPPIHSFLWTMGHSSLCQIGCNRMLGLLEASVFTCKMAFLSHLNGFVFITSWTYIILPISRSDGPHRLSHSYYLYFSKYQIVILWCGTKVGTLL